MFYKFIIFLVVFPNKPVYLFIFADFFKLKKSAFFDAKIAGKLWPTSLIGGKIIFSKCHKLNATYITQQIDMKTCSEFS